MIWIFIILSFINAATFAFTYVYLSTKKPKPIKIEVEIKQSSESLLVSEGRQNTPSEQLIIDQRLRKMLHDYPWFGIWEQNPELVKRLTGDLDLSEIGIDKDGNVS